MSRIPTRLFVLLALVHSTLAADEFFEIQFIDKESRRGIPLVELTTVHDVVHVTDNAGRIAYREPGRADEEVFFHIRAQGYRVPKDGFGFAGKRLRIAPGKSATIELERLDLAERLYRCTGRDLYRDSVLLGHKTPLREPLGTAQVAGQDSIQAALYRGKIRWFWGDTNRLSYPLGLFRTAGAISDHPGKGGLHPSVGIDYTYFTGKDGFARTMAKTPISEGVVWIDGVCTVKDAQGAEHLVAHFSRRKDLGTELEQGHLIYDDGDDCFYVHAIFSLAKSWQHLAHHPVPIEGGRFLAFGGPFPAVRVPNSYEGVLEETSFESFSCRDPETGTIRRDASGALSWKWQKSPPVTQKEEWEWIREGVINPEEARYVPVDVADPTRRVLMHHGTVRWNPFRKRWVMIATESATTKDSPSYLGEVWYSEAESPQGPWRVAVKIVTHDKQSFYNPCHHVFFDEDGGRVIYFEGTYCNTFTDSPATPRYNYNQVMYRLDLGHESLRTQFPQGP